MAASFAGNRFCPLASSGESSSFHRGRCSCSAAVDCFGGASSQVATALRCSSHYEGYCRSSGSGAELAGLRSQQGGRRASCQSSNLQLEQETRN